jgi:hypothetical protein
MSSVEMTCGNSHKHKCDDCGFVWRHLDIGEPGTEERDNDVCHTCPCGSKQFGRYRGAEPAKYVGCDRPSLTNAVDSVVMEVETKIERQCSCDVRPIRGSSQWLTAVAMMIDLLDGEDDDTLDREDVKSRSAKSWLR